MRELTFTKHLYNHFLRDKIGARHSYERDGNTSEGGQGAASDARLMFLPAGEEEASQKTAMRPEHDEVDT